MRSLTPAKVSMIMFLVVGGLIVAYVAKGLLAKPEVKPVVATRNVPMAIADLPAGTLIREEHLGMGPVQTGQLRPDMLLQTRVVIGRVTKEPLKAARPILATQLYEPGAHPALLTRHGMRTVTLPLREATSLVDGLIKPGEFADVLFTPGDLTSDVRTRGGMTVRLMKGVKIIAINRMTQQATLDNDRNTVTLEVSPEQANALMLAKDRGVITLVHTPDGEGNGKLALNEASSQDRTTLEEILGLTPVKPPEAPPAPQPPFLSQIYRSTGRQQMRFSPNGDIMENFGGWMSPYYMQEQNYYNFYQQNPQLLPQMIQQQQQMQRNGPLQWNRYPGNGNGPGVVPGTGPVSAPAYGPPRLRQPAPINTWSNTASVPNGPSA